MADDKFPVPLREVKISGAPTGRLVDLLIDEKAGRHGRCDLAIALAAPVKTTDLLELGGKNITLKTADGTLFFCGQVTKASQETIYAEDVLRLTLATLSCGFDRQAKSRTFQDPDKTLSQVLEEIKKDSGVSNADLKTGTCGKEKIPAILFQDSVTDWEFMRELASLAGQELYADAKSDVPRVSVGPAPFKSGGKTGDLREIGQKISLRKMRAIKENTDAKANLASFTETVLTTFDLGVGVGYGLSCDGKTQIVRESRITTEGSNLVNCLALTPQEGCRAEAADEMAAHCRGKYLTATVLEAQGKDKANKGQDNCLKVQFACDAKQEAGKASWLPYENIVNNYMYAMPDKGDRVAVYIGKEPMVIGSLREKEDSLGDLTPATKSFISAGQRWEMKAAELTLAQGKENELKATDSDGVSLKAKGKVVVVCDSNMALQAGADQTMSNQLQLMAPHMAGYTPYLATAGQPGSVTLNPATGMLGQSSSSLKSAGAAETKAELSDLAKELDKKAGAPKSQSEKKSSSGGGASGQLTIKAAKTLLLKVGDSSIEVSKGNIKTKALFTAGYIPGGGLGDGSPAAIGPGNVQNRSSSVKAESGSKDRPRLKAKERSGKSR